METAAQVTEHVYATASLLALEFAWPEMTGGQKAGKARRYDVPVNLLRLMPSASSPRPQESVDSQPKPGRQRSWIEDPGRTSSAR